MKPLSESSPQYFHVSWSLWGLVLALVLVIIRLCIYGPSSPDRLPPPKLIGNLRPSEAHSSIHVPWKWLYFLPISAAQDKLAILQKDLDGHPAVVLQGVLVLSGWARLRLRLAVQLVQQRVVLGVNVPISTDLVHQTLQLRRRCTCPVGTFRQMHPAALTASCCNHLQHWGWRWLIVTSNGSITIRVCLCTPSSTADRRCCGTSSRQGRRNASFNSCCSAGHLKKFVCSN